MYVFDFVNYLQHNLWMTLVPVLLSYFTVGGLFLGLHRQIVQPPQSKPADHVAQGGPCNNPSRVSILSQHHPSSFIMTKLC